MSRPSSNQISYNYNIDKLNFSKIKKELETIPNIIKNHNKIGLRSCIYKLTNTHVFRVLCIVLALAIVVGVVCVTANKSALRLDVSPNRAMTVSSAAALILYLLIIILRIIYKWPHLLI